MCLTSNLMGQEKIIVLKATRDTINDVIENGIYALIYLIIISNLKNLH